MAKTPKINGDESGAKKLLFVAPEFRHALREWFLRERRDLPWRRERSVYRTVVSEFMLQQTQVDTVLPYFEKWMQRWKNFDELASATESDVLRAWEGLGYYSRAKNLHAAARKISEEKRVPATPSECLKFRGIGAYTAAAISSIAQGVPAAVVDGNVVRILARLSGDERVFRDSASAATSFSSLAENLLDRENAGDHNEAMMELGALICSRNSPQCLICPVEKFCQAHAHGNEQTLPKFEPKKTQKKTVERLFCRRDDGAILLVRNTSGTRRLKNLCEFPNVNDFSLPAEKKSRWEIIFEGKRGIASEIITERFFLVPATFAGKLFAAFCGEKNGQAFFAGTNELDALIFSGPHRKWLSVLLEK